MFDNLSSKFETAIKNLTGKGRISEQNIEDTLSAVRTALLEADVNFKVAKDFIQAVKEKALGEKVITGVNPGQQFVKIMHDELARVMGSNEVKFNFHQRPLVILVCGLNGAGKTTFSGKLGLWLKTKEKKVSYLVPADNFRPAAKDQLLVHAKNLDLPYFDSDLSMTPAQIAALGVAEGAKRGHDVIIVDTAGRLNLNEDLMNELKDVKNALSSYNLEIMLVADAMTGQEGVQVAQSFHQAVGLTGVVLTKMDSDARGGAALSIRYSTGVPLRFLSTGEKLSELEVFHPDRLAGRILDMGDVVSLVEKAQEVIDEDQAMKVMDKIGKNKFTIQDFLTQLEAIGKMGPMMNVLKMIPGMGGALRQVGDLAPAENELKRIKVIIGSMTSKEREEHKLLGSESRIKRIAAGSGTKPNEVRDFLKKFEQMRGMMSGLMGMMKGGMPAMPGMPGGVGAMPSFPGMNPGMGKKKLKNKRKGPWG